jgi:hypothetical protein
VEIGGKWKPTLQQQFNFKENVSLPYQKRSAGAERVQIPTNFLLLVKKSAVWTISTFI